MVGNAFELADAAAAIGGTAQGAAVRDNVLRGSAVAAVRHHIDRARRMYLAAGAVVAEAGLHTTEVWLALIDGDRATAEAHVAAYVEQTAVYGPDIGPDVLRLGIAHRFGTPEEVIERAPPLLARIGAPERTSVVAVLATLTLAVAHGRRGDVDAAAGLLRPALRMARELDGPRFVAHSLIAAAELARARGEHGAALDLAARAWHHPAVEYEQRKDLRALVDGLRGPWPPPVPHDGDADDGARLERVEVLVGEA